MATTRIPCWQKRRSTLAANGIPTGSSYEAMKCGSWSTARTSSPERWGRPSTLRPGTRKLVSGRRACSSKCAGSRFRCFPQPECIDTRWPTGETAMRHAQHSRASSRRTVRRGVPRWLAVATESLILALVLEVAFGVSTTAVVRAQVMVTAKPSVTVFGAGEATVPADSATVQILISHGGRQFGFSQDASGGGAFESASAISESGSPPEPVRVPRATPETSAAGTEGAVSTRERRGGRTRHSGPEPITAERLAPVVAAVATSAGITPDAVAIIFSPLATEPFGRRPESARLDFDVAAPTPEALNNAIIAASDAAAANGLVVEVAGVHYRPSTAPWSKNKRPWPQSRMPGIRRIGWRRCSM